MITQVSTDHLNIKFKIIIGNPFIILLCCNQCNYWLPLASTSEYIMYNTYLIHQTSTSYTYFSVSTSW